MRAWISRQTGTNTWITVPLDPPYSVDPDTGVEQTSMEVWDGFRPEFPPTSGASIPTVGRNPTQPLWVVIDFTITVAPVGAFDLGDPSDPDWQVTALTNPEKNYVRQQFPDDPDAQVAETRGDALRLFAAQHRTTLGGLVVEWLDESPLFVPPPDNGVVGGEPDRGA